MILRMQYWRKALKAIVFSKYGSPDVLKFENIQKSVPNDDEVLVKVYASSVNFNTTGHVKGKPFAVRLWFGLTKPKFRTPGNDIAGRVEAVGKNIYQFHPGDDVFGDISESGFGAFAEYACVRENTLVLKPANLEFKEAAAVPEAAIVALQGLRATGKFKVGLTANTACSSPFLIGQKVLIYGASGGIGTFAVQICQIFRSRSNRSLQPEKSGNGAIDWFRLCYRLYKRRLY